MLTRFNPETVASCDETTKWQFTCDRSGVTPDGSIRPGIGKHRTAPRAGPWKNCYRAVRNQGQIGPKVTETTDIRNTLRMPSTTISSTGQSILLWESKPRSLTESVPWWLNEL